MRNVALYTSDSHRFIMLNEAEPAEELGIPSNQFLIVHQDAAVLLDPGGFGVMPRVLTELLQYVEPHNLRAIILSHQDPDIVGGLNTWLELSQARVYAPRIWLRFLPHYGLRDVSSFIGVPDEGMACEIAPGLRLDLLPAHFLHSPGQINVWDPVSRVLFSGDIGASVVDDPTLAGQPIVSDFERVRPGMEAFHKRYMACNRALRHWVNRVEKLDIDILAPQHGPLLRQPAINAFLNWARDLRCGADLLTDDSHE